MHNTTNAHQSSGHKLIALLAVALHAAPCDVYQHTALVVGICLILAISCVAEKDSPPTGTDTVGSSEAVLLGGLALKRRWQERRKKAGLDVSKPNIVMGTETHVVRHMSACIGGGVERQRG